MNGLTKQALDEARSTNMGHRLVALANDFAERILSCYRQQGYEQIRPLHGALLRNLELDGTRLTTLASRAGMTHRAMAKIVAEVEKLGFVLRSSDSIDGRATLVCFTDAGLRLLRDSSVIIEQVYTDYSAVAGPQLVERLEHRLYDFLSCLGVEVLASGQQALHSPRPAVFDRGSTVYLSHNLGRYLQLAADDYHRRCATIMARRGHPGVRFDHLAVLSHLSLDSISLTDLAESAAISPQAIGRQVRAVGDLGYVSISVDKTDRRIRRVSFTEAGLDFIRELLHTFREIERGHRQQVGSRRVQWLQSSLAQLVAAIEIEVPARHIKPL